MNDDQLRRSWRIGLGAMGIIPVLQLCYLAYFGRHCRQNGIDFVTVLSNPPPSLFVMLPLAGIVAAVCLGLWVGFLVARKTVGIIHVTICQVVLMLLALHLTMVVLRTSGLVSMLSVIRTHNEQRSQNNTSDGIRQPADGLPKPSR